MPRFFSRCRLPATALMALMALIALLAWSPDAAANELKIGVRADAPPFSFVDEEGQRRGFEVELAEALCAQLSRQCEFIAAEAMRPSDVAAGLREGTFDAALASIPISKENRALFALTESYYKEGGKFIRRKSDKERISYAAMRGKNIGVVADTKADKFLREKFTGAHIHSFATPEEAYDALQNDSVSYLLRERIAAAQWVKAHSKEYAFAGPSYTNKKYFSAYGIALKDPRLQEEFNNAIAELWSQGAYKKINARYFPFSVYGRR